MVKREYLNKGDVILISDRQCNDLIQIDRVTKKKIYCWLLDSDVDIKLPRGTWYELPENRLLKATIVEKA